MANRADILFSLGDTVTVHALNAEGCIVEVLSPDLYRVALRSLHITVKGSDISLASAAPLPAQLRVGGAVKVVSSGHTRVPRSLDLHGLTVDEARHALEQWLNSIIIAGVKQGKVIHGLGSGKVQRTTHETLSNYAAVRAFRVNDLNPGETDVYLE